MKNALVLYSTRQKQSSLYLSGFVKELGWKDISKYEKLSSKRKLSFLAGRFLLKKGIELLGLDADLKDLKFTQNYKPYLPLEICFNISHSDEMIVCAVSSDNIRLGVDAQYHKNNCIEQSELVFNQKELLLIKESEKYFFDLWTKKEGIIKACGGHIFQMNKVDCTINPIYFDGNFWFAQNLPLSPDYTVNLITNEPVSVNLKKVN